MHNESIDSPEETLIDLISSFCDENPGQRESAAESFYQVCINNPELKNRALKLLNRSFRENIQPSGKREAAFISAMLLGKIGGKAVLSSLAKLLEYTDPYIRRCASAALAETGCFEAVPFLTGLFNDPVWINRKETSDNLAGMGKCAVKELNSVFKSGNSDERYWALRSLALILGQKAMPVFENILNSENNEKNEEAKYYVLSVLKELNLSDMDMIFNKALNDESQLIRNKARQILPCSNTNYKKIILLIFLFLIVITAEYHILKKNEKPKNLALNMKHAVALKRLGDVFIEKKSSSDDEKKKNYSQAEKYFTSALEKIESYPDAWVMLANIKYKARDFNKALEYAQNAEKYADNNWDNYKDMRHETYLLMGNLYTLKRDFKKAREMYLKSLELKPSYQPAETGLKQIEKYIDFYLNKTR